MPHLDKPMNLMALLDGVQTPVARAGLVIYAQSQDASDDALNAIRGLPDREFSDMQDINSSLGHIKEMPGQNNLFSSNKHDKTADDQTEEQIDIAAST